ncbi:UNKNOWN [Stylonychia lemnae]|uniref:Uncharacterized protein n=1 Tax=Stylonychia lemnae TaxID=5949 RepID=A0A078A4I4_STYLE|nr:UNKNOWN [Stylonychia lemnae]|eukprot:CDW76804.1 UNKNOWN [Stylonychia lemnae]
MGGVCSSKQDHTTPETSNMLYSNDPLLHSHEKSINLHDQKLNSLFAKYLTCVKIAQDPQNDIQIDNKLRQRLQDIDIQKQNVEGQKQTVHDKLSYLKTTSHKAEEFGALQKDLRDQVIAYEEQIQQFDSKLRHLKQNWDQSLVMEQVRVHIMAKMKTNLEKTSKKLGQVKELVDREQNDIDHFQALLSVLQQYEEFQSQYQTIFQIINQLLEQDRSELDVIKADIQKSNQTQQQYLHALNDSLTQSSEFENLSQLASSINTLKQSLTKNTVQLEASYNNRKFVLELLGDFGVSNTIKVFEEENKKHFDELLNRLEGNPQAYKKALQLQMITETDEQGVEALKQVEAEVDEIIQETSEVKQDIEKLRSQLSELLEQQTQYMEGESINLGKLHDLLQSYKSLKEKQHELFDDLYAIEKDLEIKKIEAASGNTLTKLNDFRIQIERQLAQLDKNQEISDLQDAIINDLLVLFANSADCVLNKISVGVLNLLKAQVDIEHENQIRDQIGQAEQKVNDLLLFWDDQIKSGNALSNPEDAQFLLTELQAVQVQLQQTELQVEHCVLKVYHNRTRLNGFVLTLGQFFTKTLDVHVQLFRIILKYSKNYQNQYQIDEKVKDQIKLRQVLLSALQQDEDPNSNAKNTLALISQIIKSQKEIFGKFPKQISQIYDINENGRHSLIWGQDSDKLVVIDGVKEERDKVEIKEVTFVVSDSTNPAQQALQAIQLDNPKSKYLSIQFKDLQTIIIGGQFEYGVKVIEDQLCIKYGGGFMLFNEFVNSQYLDLISKQNWMSKEIKQIMLDLIAFAQAFSLALQDDQ